MDFKWNFSYVILSCFIYFTSVQCQQFSDNTPPIMWLDRTWRILNTETVGNVITRVHAQDNEHDTLEFGLEPIDNYHQSTHLPFRIDKDTGVVYLNESLQDKVGQSTLLYVTVSDGKLTAKSEVWVTIINNSTKTPSNIRPPFLQLPHHPPRPPPSVPIAPLVNNAANDLNEPNADLPVRSVSGDVSNALVPVLAVCVIFLTIAIVAFLFRKKIYLDRNKDTKNDLTKESIGGIILQEGRSLAIPNWTRPRVFTNRYESWQRENANHVMSSTTENETSISDSEIASKDRWEFPRHRLKIFNILGEGAFGQVWRCEATDIGLKEGVSITAVKTLKENATEKESSDLISELQIMKMLEPHPNVVRLLGCCTEKEPFFLIMEYVSRGKLQSFLRSSRAERYYGNMHGKSKSLTSRDLTSFVYQVARGMEHLSSKGIIHRDLAARNVLVTEEYTCKVADFGFARDVTESQNHVYERKSEGRLPIRWMAPESLYDNVFSVRSDVWSFGVLIWEVVTLGSTPYPGLSAADVMRKVRDGHRLDKPEHCRRELYNIMYYCWDKDPNERPSFLECVQLLENLLLTDTDYIELERFPDHSYYNMASLSGEKL